MSCDIGVVGGVYNEVCSFPRDRLFRGSGLRSSLILKGLGNKVLLVTAIGEYLKCDLEYLSGRHGVELKMYARDQEISFIYRHPLGLAEVYPPSPVESEVSEASVGLKNAVVFGMVEGRATVNASCVVYDPQDGYKAKRFSENGSTAERLAIVASYSEGKALTGKTIPEEMCRELLEEQGCEVVVVKCGPQGAVVATKDSIDYIGSFPTEKVWKIGSGDAFTSAFAHAWISQKKTALEAAWFASRLVAEYVQTRKEEFPSDVVNNISKEADIRASYPGGEGFVNLSKLRVYLAGPFFSTAEQWLIEEAKGCFEGMGFTVFSPIHEVGVGDAKHVAGKDLEGLQSSDVVFAVIDGLDPGTIFEVGYAKALGKPVVGVAESVKDEHLTMVIGTNCTVKKDFSSAIYNACWELMASV